MVQGNEVRSGQHSVLYSLKGLFIWPKAILPSLIHFKTNLQACLFDRRGENMSEGESDLIQIFLFNLRLLVAMGTQKYSMDLKER